MFITLFAVSALLALSSTVRAEFLFLEDGKEYVYDTISKAFAGTMDVATHAAATSARWTTRFQISGTKLNVKFDGIEVSQFNGPKGAQEDVFLKTQFFGMQSLGSPEFTMTFNDEGLLDALTMNSEYPTKVKNVIKGFATSIQLNVNKIKSGKHAFKSQEKLVNGECDVTYSVSDHFITKTVTHHQDCKNTVHRTIDDFRGHMCKMSSSHDHQHHATHNTLAHPESIAITTYTLEKKGDKRHIHSFQTTGSFVTQFFKEEGRTQFVHTNTTSTLREVKDSSGDISPSGEQVTDFKYRFEDEDYKWNQDRDLKAKEPFFSSHPNYFKNSVEEIKASLKSSIASQLEIMRYVDPDNKEGIQTAHKYGINKVLPSFYALDYDSLRSVAEELYADKSEDGTFKSNLFGELLGTAGTTATAMLVRDFVLENKFANDRDAARILTSVPYHIRRPNTQLVKEFEKLLDVSSERFLAMSIPLVFGHLVRTTCLRAGQPHSDEVRTCFKDFASKYVTRFVDEYKATQSLEKKGMLLHVIMNIGHGGVAEALRPIVYGAIDGEHAHLTSTAMWAAYYDIMMQHKAYKYYMPIFADESKATELRINAFIAIVRSHPDASQLSNIVAILNREKSYEVLNFALTTFEYYANTINPCNEDTKPMMKYYLKFMKQFSPLRAFYGFGVSKMYSREFEREKYGYGGQVEFYTIGSEDSTTPLSVGMMMTNTIMQSYQIQEFAVHLRVEGLAKHMIRVFKTSDPTTWKTEDLKKILFTQMGIRQREDQPVRVQISVIIKNAVIFNRYYDDTDTKSEGKLLTFFQEIKQLGDSYKINHQRAMQVGSILYEQPSSNGLPMAALTSTTTLFSLRAEISRGNHRGLLFRDIEYEIDVFSQSSQVTLIPMEDASFGIMNDRIYLVRIPRSFVLGVNPLTRELRYKTKRPPHTDPMKMVMHSQSSVLIRANTIKGHYDQLKKSCPECDNEVVISKGADAGRGRSIIDLRSDVCGSHLRGGYFDCEMDISRGNTISHALKAFMPYNKNIKSLYNTVVMGIRQIRTYFFLFPRTEKCGLAMKYSQSEDNPVTTIDVTVRGKVEDEGQRMFFRGKKYTIKANIKAIGKPVDRSYYVSMTYGYTPGRIQNNLKIKMKQNPVPELDISPYSVCFAMENKYPEFSSEFLNYDASTPMHVTGKAKLNYGPVEGCANSTGELQVDFDHSTTEEARESMKDQWYYKQCMKSKNSEEWSTAVAYPLTEACYQTLWDATTARRYKYDIKFTKLTDRMKYILSKARIAIEAGLLPYWNFENTATSTEIGPFLNIDASFRNHERNVDLILETRQGKEVINDISLNLPFWPKMMRNLKFTSTLKRLFEIGVLSPCIVTKSTVRSNDNSTYTYQPSPCWTLLSGHCSPHPAYAVFAKQGSGSSPVDARIFIGGHEILMSGNEIKVNGAPAQIKMDESYEHKVDGTEIFSIFRWGSTYNIYSFLKVWVTYDGNFVEVMPAPSTKGQHCGVCGNYNRNKFDDWTAKDMSSLSSTDQLVENYKWEC